MGTKLRNFDRHLFQLLRGWLCKILVAILVNIIDFLETLYLSYIL